MPSPSVSGPGPRFIDLFAGCGGFTEGFVQAGARPVMAIELDPAAAATYRHNFGDHVLVEDIGHVDAMALPDADVVIGGPPCQGFSQLGTRDPSDPRNALIQEYLRVVRSVQPDAFVLENVPQFLKSGQFELLIDSVHEGGLLDGYRLSYDVLNAADYGVPQRRRRAFVVGTKVGEPSLPGPTHGEGPRKPWLSLADALNGIPFATTSTRLPDRRLPDGTPGPFKATEIHLGRNPTKLSLDRYNQVPPGGNRFDLDEDLLPPCWQDRPSGSTDVMGRLEWDKPALTIRTEFFKPEKGRYLHPQWDPDDPTRRVNRALTHWEAARIQGFPDDFAWCGTKAEIARQIGNAVPVGLAKAVADSLGSVVGEPTV